MVVKTSSRLVGERQLPEAFGITTKDHLGGIMKDKKILTMNGLVNKKDLAPKVTYIDNLKVRKYKKRGEYYAQRALAKGRSVEEIWDSIFGVEKKERPVLSLKPTKHYPSGDNCCLPNVAVFSGVKTKQPSSEFGVTAR